MSVELPKPCCRDHTPPCTGVLCSPGDFVVDVVSGAVAADPETPPPSLKASATGLTSSSIAALWRKHQTDLVGGDAEPVQNSASLATLGARKQVRVRRCDTTRPILEHIS